MKLYPKQARLTLLASDGAKTEQADFSALDFEFEVTAKLPLDKKDKNKTEPIKAHVTVYGLNDETREKLSANKTATKIEYGYGDEILGIFEGLNVNVIHQGIRTEIYASHSWEAYKRSFFSKSYESEIPLKTVLDDVLKSFGLPFSNLYSRGDKLIGGAFFDGESKSVLDDLCRDWSLNWRIDNHSVILEDSINPPLVDRTRVVVLGPSLISGPTVDESLEDEGTKKEKVVRRVSAVSMLLPQLWPGVPVQFDTLEFGRSSGDIETRKLSKFNPRDIFICDEVTHKGFSGIQESTTSISTKEEKV